MPYRALRKKTWLVSILPLAAAAPIAGCGAYLVDELGGLIAEDLSPAVANSCGPSGPLELLIPDCPLGLACFSAACNRHDICYGTCGVSRVACDTQFFQDMVSICYAHLLGEDEELARCLVLAYVYWDAVRIFGGEAFDDTHRLVCAGHQDKSDVGMGARLMLADPPGDLPFDDKDNDLMPDDWEVSVALDPDDPIDATQDFDSDGLVNLQEFIHDTDPFSPDSDGVESE